MLTACVDCGRDDRKVDRRGLCPACYQRRWKADTLPPLPPREHVYGKPIAVTRWGHGTYNCYNFERCRCEPCTRASTERKRDQARRRSARAWSGEPDSWVDGDIVRGHLHRLADAGIGYKTVADAAGLSASTLTSILYGRHRADPTHPEHRPPRRRVARATAEAVLAVQVDPNLGAIVDATGTRRRIQALAVVGWTHAQIAATINVSPSNLSSMLDRGCVRRSTADAVRQAYETMWRGPVIFTPGQRRARTRAERAGWAPPMAWDDETMDDPSAQPQIGDDITASDARAANVRELLDFGEHPDAVLVRIGMKRSSFDKWAHRVAPDLIELMAEARAIRAGA